MSHLRMVRSSSLISPSLLTAQSITIVGVGAIGLQVARMAAAIGIGTIALIDDDAVSEENLGPQQWPPGSLNGAKVWEARDILLELNPSISVQAVEARYEEGSTLTTPIVIACADCMDTRRLLSEHFSRVTPTPECRRPLFIDARMTAFYHEVHAYTKADIHLYKKTLFPPPPPSERPPCTARATAMCAQMAASWIITTLVQHLRSEPIPRLLTCCMSAPIEITTVYPEP